MAASCGRCFSSSEQQELELEARTNLEVLPVGWQQTSVRQWLHTALLIAPVASVQT